VDQPLPDVSGIAAFSNSFAELPARFYVRQARPRSRSRS